MPGHSYSLLENPFLSVRLREGTLRRLTLPEALEALGADQVDAFTALQGFQQHAWHAFTVQLAALALHRAGESRPDLPAARWQEWLLELTGGHAGPWCLVVEDLAQPAFLQPPVPEKSLSAFKNVIRYADALDILVTSKNHDLKAARVRTPEPEHWIYALVSLQTMQGFLGAGNYGIARMNGGFASRPGIGVAAGLRPGQRFDRDVRVLLDDRPRLLENGYADEGLALLWLTPWDGKSALALSALDPFFIEICRRVRATAAEGHLELRATSTETSRISAKEQKGVTGDAWTPVQIEKADAKALTVGDAGFDYRLTAQLLMGDGKFREAPAQKLRPDDPQNVFFVAQVLARGQGQTAGYHERIVEIPRHVRPKLLGKSSERERLARRVQQRIQDVDDSQRRVLRMALLILVQGAPASLKLDDERPRRWIDRHEARVDAAFFTHLWESADQSDTDARAAWDRLILDWAEALLEEAIDEAPLPDARRYEVISKALAVFHGSRRKVFPHLFPAKENAA